MGVRACRQLVDRDARSIGQRLKHEELCAAQSDLPLGPARRLAERLHDPADGVERSLGVADARCIGNHIYILYSAERLACKKRGRLSADQNSDSESYTLMAADRGRIG